MIFQGSSVSLFQASEQRRGQSKRMESAFLENRNIRLCGRVTKGHYVSAEHVCGPTASEARRSGMVR